MKTLFTLTALALLVNVANAADRDYISIVGSSTVYPYSTVVAERFGKSGSFKTPKIESTGTGGGMKLFCAGAGANSPDITNASRAMKDSERADCIKNGVKDIVEVNVGYDGIVLANSKSAKQIELSLRELYLATAKMVPSPDGAEKLVANPYNTWDQINKTLPALKIEIIGPPTTSGTRDAFEELAMEGGCSSFDFLKGLQKSDKKAFEKACKSIREDGAYIDAGENDNLIIQKLRANPKAFGIFGFAFLDQNSNIIQASKIAGKIPTHAGIADGTYPLSRPLFFYVKKDHIAVIPGMKEFLAEFSSEKAWGDDGYLVEKGLVPLAKGKRTEMAAAVKALKTMQ